LVVFQGSTVYLHVSLMSTVDITGNLTIEIKTDNSTGFDGTPTTCAFSNLALVAGFNQPKPCAFLANSVTTGSLKQYFFRVLWNGAPIYDPTDHETRERLTVLVPVVAPTPAPTPTSAT
jgi:hypothetical protein